MQHYSMLMSAAIAGWIALPCCPEEAATVTPSWLGSTAGLSEAVPAPWMPVTYGKGAFGLWERTYTLGESFLPERIAATGEELLVSPVRLDAVVDGLTQTWKRSRLRSTGGNEARRSVGFAAESESLAIEGTIDAEFDGLLTVSYRLSAKGGKPARLDKLALVIPVRRECARYIDYFPGVWGNVDNARSVPKEGIRVPLKPSFWLGDEDRGLTFIARSDEGFRPLDRQDVITVTPGPDATELRVSIVAEPWEGFTSQEYQFALQATPVKPVTEDVWDMRICHHGDYGIESRVVQTPAWIDYPAEENMLWAAGTIEAWVRPNFDPNPKVDPADPNRGQYNRNLMVVDLPGSDEIGFYWNVDDHGMRVYVRQADQNPMVFGTRCEWQKGEWHHVALTWGDSVRIYIDGELRAEQPYRWPWPDLPPESVVRFGGGLSEFDVDEVRISSVARDSFDLNGPLQDDEQTLLLDHLDELAGSGDDRRSVPERGSAGTVAAGVQQVEGKLGRAVTLYEPVAHRTMLDQLAELGVRTIVFHEHWTEIQNYTKTSRGEDLRSLVAACHAKGIKLLLYFGYEMSNIAPEWETYSEQCLVQPRAGGYHRQPEQNAYIVCYESPWIDFMADGIAKVVDEYDIDGVYLDGTAAPWACANQAHGCGYVAPDGTVRPTYGIHGARNMMMRIYNIVRSRKPDGLVNVHESMGVIPSTMAFATSYWDGEQLGGIDRGKWALDVLPLDAFRAEFMGRNYGIPAELLCYDRPYTYREAMSFSLLHDILVRGSLGSGLELESKLWQVMDDFGRREADFIPYWSDRPAATSDVAAARITAYARGRRGSVLVVSNLGPEPVEATVTLDRERLGLPRGAKLTAVDALSGSSLPIAGDGVLVSLSSLDFALVRVALPD